MLQEKAGVSHQLSVPTHPQIEICSSKIDTTAEHTESDTDLLIENNNL